jgi:hypothetical protein
MIRAPEQMRRARNVTLAHALTDPGARHDAMPRQRHRGDGLHRETQACSEFGEDAHGAGASRTEHEVRPDHDVPDGESFDQDPPGRTLPASTPPVRS